MRNLYKKTIQLEEYAYESEEECQKHVQQMKENGFEIEENYHDIYAYYRKYIKHI